MDKVYASYFKLYFRSLQAYRLNWFISLAKLPLIFCLYWFLWKTIYRYHDGPIVTYDFEAMIIYLFAVQWIGLTISRNVAELIASDVRSGQLSITLARPIHYLPTRFADFCAHWSLGVAISVIPFAMLFTVIGDAALGILDYCEFLVAMSGSAVVFFLLEACLGCCAFWLQKIFGLHYLLLTVLNIAGGKLIPLTLFPAWFQQLSYISPLRAIYYDPIQILFGQPVGPVLVMQGLWALALLGLLVLLWSRGRGIYEACG